MNQSLIKEILDQYHKLTPATFSEFFEMLDMVEVPRGDIFIIRGKQDEFEYIVLDGVCRSYLLNPEGEEVTVAFFQINLYCRHISPAPREACPPSITRHLLMLDWLVSAPKNLKSSWLSTSKFVPGATKY